MNPVEKVVSTALQRYLGDFLEGLENLKISIFKGIVKQTDVRFRPEALKNLNLPVTVKSGIVKTLTIDVPIMSLQTNPTTVVLDEVYVIAGPGHCVFDDTFEARLQETKRRRLQVAEALKGDIEEEKKGDKGSLIRSVAEKIVQNLTIEVKRVHVRYEDVDASGTPFAFGLTLESLQGVAAGPDWAHSLGGAVDGVFRKLIALRNLAIYWDRLSPPLEFTSLTEMSKRMSALIHCSKSPLGAKNNSNIVNNNNSDSGENHPIHSYILPPCSSSARLTLNTAFETTRLPQLDMAFSFEAIRIALGLQQWRQLTKVSVTACARACVSIFLDLHLVTKQT
jgi:hypothetical protein